jgi:hypothetical protein
MRKRFETRVYRFTFPSLAVVENLRFTFSNLLMGLIRAIMYLIYKGLQAQTTTCCAVA